MLKIIIRYIAICIALLYLPSCTLLKPLPLEPFNNANAMQGIEKPGLSAFNGDYEIVSTNSSFCTLDYALAYSGLLDLKKQPTKNVYVNLKAIDERHINVKFFVNNEMVQEKTIQGRLTGNYFSFHKNQLKFRFLINVYNQQTNRIALSKEGDLYLDTNRGGIAFLIIIPVPLTGTSYDTYNLMFKRRK